MIAKGVISHIVENGAEVILPEYDNVVTAVLSFAEHISTPRVGDKCVVALFDSDTVSLANGVILAIYS